ncbi:MAG: flagellar hook-length control protein FliK [Candidatus Omnitrophica bacterium]|nr:flagellar hook-length control protein FliK [Candidatus Omnitrophota bacterium]MCM8823870.1 flagellar hook-length control protein FliK [Candidatus Omnitrophota bacterium]MCM8826387.1 flagellar hook-length control protein FliK [Candidatus Omnitrophota bacterium]
MESLIPFFLGENLNLSDNLSVFSKDYASKDIEGLFLKDIEALFNKKLLDSPQLGAFINNPLFYTVILKLNFFMEKEGFSQSQKIELVDKLLEFISSCEEENKLYLLQKIVDVKDTSQLLDLITQVNTANKEIPLKSNLYYDSNLPNLSQDITSWNKLEEGFKFLPKELVTNDKQPIKQNLNLLEERYLPSPFHNIEVDKFSDYIEELFDSKDSSFKNVTFNFSSPLNPIEELPQKDNLEIKWQFLNLIKETVERITFQNKFNKDWQTFIELKQDNLGQLHLKLELADDKLTLNIVVSQNQTQELINSYFSELKQAIEDKGLILHNFNVEVNPQFTFGENNQSYRFFEPKSLSKGEVKGVFFEGDYSSLGIDNYSWEILSLDKDRINCLA